MIEAVIALFLSQPADADALRATVPDYLTASQAAEHYAAARAAGARYHVEPEVLLAVAWHESRYEPWAVSREPGGRVSCGVMTPEPKRRCTAYELSMVGGYERGAAHLRVWLDRFGDDYRLALWAYAGGGVNVRACLDGSESRACLFAGQMLARARAIRRRPAS